MESIVLFIVLMLVIVGFYRWVRPKVYAAVDASHFGRDGRSSGQWDEPDTKHESE